jgi:hypothetical protein
MTTKNYLQAIIRLVDRTTKKQSNLGYFEGNIVKYVSRWQDKGGVQDLQKAKHYLEKLLELQNGNK